MDKSNMDRELQMQSEEKKAYDKGWHKRNADCLKVLENIKEEHENLLKKTSDLIDKLREGKKY